MNAAVDWTDRGLFTLEEMERDQRRVAVSGRSPVRLVVVSEAQFADICRQIRLVVGRRGPGGSLRNVTFRSVTYVVE